MTRPPLAAWRRLFAIGGAPAASHVTLSRAPSSDRLLDPLKDARVARAAALEALVKPLDIAGVLAKVSTGSPSVAATSEVDPADRVRVRTHTAAASREDDRSSLRRERTADRTSRSSAPRVRVAVSELPRARRAGELLKKNGDAANVPTAAGEQRVDSPSSMLSKTSFFGEGDAASASRFAAQFSALATPTTDDRSASRSNDLTAAATNGANARVIVGAGSADIRRLLQSDDPGRAMLPRNAPTANRVTNSAVSDVGDLLATAVGRARQALASATTNDARYFSPASERGDNSGAVTATQRDLATNSATVSDSSFSGGFRGLAQRTLTTSRTSSTVAPQHIEAESRTSSDLTLDTLDSRVADSLARVLEREARRHGIDIDEVWS